MTQKAKTPQSLSEYEFQKYCRPEYYNFLSPYGLGDTLMLCGFKKAWERKNKGKIHFLIKPSHEIVMKLYGITDYTCVNIEARVFRRYAGPEKPRKGELFVAHPYFGGSPKVMDRWYNNLLNFREFYLELLGLNENAVFEFPKVKPQTTYQLPQKVDLNKSIFISGSAATARRLDASYWMKIIQAAQEKGYTVVNNCVNADEVIPGCLNLTLPLEDIMAIALKCRKIYCLRSGLSDLLMCFGSERMEVIYPDRNLLDLYSINESFKLPPQKAVREILENETIQKNKPLVTIITPSYNLIQNKRQKSFERMLESVALQTYQNIEHLVIDGGSTDSTVDLFKKLQKKYHFQFVSEPDNGIYDAMNKGVKAAKGKYVVFMNTDDYFTVYALEKHVNILEVAKADFSFAIARIFKENNERYVFYPCEKLFFYTMPFSHQTLFCKRDILLKMPFNCKYKLAADFDFIQHLYLENYRSVFVPFITAYYDASGISGKSQDQALQEYMQIAHANLERKLGLTKEEIRQMVYQFQISRHMQKKMEDYFRRLDMQTYKRLFYDTDYQVRKMKILSVIPITIQEGTMMKWVSICHIPLIQIKHKQNRVKVKIAGIPILEKRSDAFSYKLRLFGFINLFTSKKVFFN